MGDYTESLWERDDLTPEEKATMIHDCALRLLSGESEPEENLPHGGGIPLSAEQKALESDARLLTGCNIIPRKMSKAELQAAADRLTGGRSEDDVIEAAIQRREAKHLIGHHSGGFHQ
jgi:hypothetical protein